MQDASIIYEGGGQNVKIKKTYEGGGHPPYPTTAAPPPKSFWQGGWVSIAGDPFGRSASLVGRLVGRYM